VAGTRWNQSQAAPRARHRNIASGRRSARRLRSPFTISELAERTGVPVPTIHYYRRLGLLPDPEVMAANRYLYDDRHVEVLAMIRLLRQERQMSLASIAEVLPGLLPDEGEEAFRPQMWDQVLAAHLEDAALSEPPARLVTAARGSFARDGYAGVTIAEICEGAGIAIGSFYRHFETKDAIFVAAVRSVGDALGAELDRLPFRLSSRRATAMVTALLEPFVPLLLESALRARRGSKELSGVVADVMHAVATRLEPHLRPSERSCERDDGRGRLVVHAALLEQVGDALGLDAL
jgi:AcrR family transcriptional regulator/transcriptional regulator with XRE-family HTH domain